MPTKNFEQEDNLLLELFLCQEPRQFGAKEPGPGHLDSDLIEQVNRMVKAKGGLRKGYSFSGELTTALKEYVQHQTIQQEESTLAPMLQRMLDEKFIQLEQWLRPGTWGGATYSTTAALLLLEVLCGHKIDPKEAKEHFELIRGRAWKIVRRDPETEFNRGSK